MNNPSETGNDLWAEFAKAARQGPSIYFAPVRGAVMGFLSQWLKTPLIWAILFQICGLYSK